MNEFEMRIGGCENDFFLNFSDVILFYFRSEFVYLKNFILLLYTLIFYEQF